MDELSEEAVNKMLTVVYITEVYSILSDKNIVQT